MELGAAVVRPREASATKAGRLHVEIAPILLHQHVGRHLGSAKEAVQRGVDRHVFADAVPVGVILGDLPTGFGFDQRKAVRGVAVDLVGAGEDEHCIGAMIAGGLQNIESAIGVDGEIGVRIRGAQSCDGCAAVWTMSEMSEPYLENRLSMRSVSRISPSTCT